MKSSLALLIVLVASSLVSATASALCPDQTVIKSFQTTFEIAAKKNSYAYQKVDSVKYQMVVRSGRQARMEVGWERDVVVFKNETFFDMDVYEAYTGDLIKDYAWLLGVDPKTCQVLKADVVDYINAD